MLPYASSVMYTALARRIRPIHHCDRMGAPSYNNAPFIAKPRVKSHLPEQRLIEYQHCSALNARPNESWAYPSKETHHAFGPIDDSQPCHDRRSVQLDCVRSM